MVPTPAGLPALSLRYEGMVFEPSVYATPTGWPPSETTLSSSPVSSTTTRTGLFGMTVLPIACLTVRAKTPAAASVPKPFIFSITPA